MHIAAKWLNSYLEPGDLTASQIEAALIDAGFEIESQEKLANGDTKFDVAITSNRGDALSVVGLAREAAAKTGRKFKFPSAGGMTNPEPVVGGGGDVSSAIKLENRVPKACPMFTVRVIKGVKVGPSPAWLAEALESVGQRSINNVVDVTNFINFELGNPCHVFDLAKLGGGALVVREAAEGEKLQTLDGKQRVLKAGEIVVADANRAQGLAGVMGGGDSEVSGSTVDVALEVATWDPVKVRGAARRLQIRTDASHRYERIVDARTLEHASKRAASLIVEVAGGQLLSGVLTAGNALEPRKVVSIRPERCAKILGVAISEQEISAILQKLEIDVEKNADGSLRCTIPVFRPDLTREIDLIEEVARQHGLDKIVMSPKLAIAVTRPQEKVKARKELGATLSGLGFFETVTFSFTKPERAKAFIPVGLEIVGVDDDRRGAEPTLRPTLLTGLLGCRKANQDGQVNVPGGVRLYETAAVYAQQAGKSVETRNLGLLMDVPFTGKAATFAEKQNGVRALRGVIESLVRRLGGESALTTLKFEAANAHAPAFDGGAYASILVNGKAIGYLSLLTSEATKDFGLEIPLVASELNLDALLALYPPKGSIAPLPQFPSVERDLSPVLPESVTWENVSKLVESVRATPAGQRIESFNFIGTYRGKQIGQGKKSLTLRLIFRDKAKTLRHEEVDPEVGVLVDRLKGELSAEFRGV